MSHRARTYVISVCLASLMSLALCASKAEATIPTPTPQPTPSTSATSTPSPSPSAPVKSFCANKNTGHVSVLHNALCPPATSSLGAGRIEVRGQSRPQTLDPFLKARFNALRASAATKGFTVSIRSGWRSVNHQQALFTAAVQKYGSVSQASKWVLPPSRSMHTWGLAIDVKFAGATNATNVWVQTNARFFGLCRVYRNEWWHFEPLVSPGGRCPPRKG